MSNQDTRLLLQQTTNAPEENGNIYILKNENVTGFILTIRKKLTVQKGAVPPRHPQR